MSDTPSFGRWLKHLRAGLDLTQEALAEAVETMRALESSKPQVERPPQAVARARELGIV